MANWGSQRIQTLDVPPSAILASFLHSLAWKQEIVAYEVILAVRRLVTKYTSSYSFFNLLIQPFWFVLFWFVLFCFVLFCFVLFCFVLFCFVLFCFVLLFCFGLFWFGLFCFVLFVNVIIHRYGPDLSMEWDLVLLVLNKIHAIADFHENNLFNMLKETVITIEGIQPLNIIILFDYSDHSIQN